MSKIDFSEIEIIVIGASAGGIDALNAIVPAIQKTGKIKTAIVIHIPPEGPNLIPSLLQNFSELKVSEGMSGEPMEADHIYISPNDYHLCIEPNLSLSLSSEAQVNFSRPAIDILFESAAFAGAKKTLGILLTGANEDGAAGLKKIMELGGKSIVQDPKTAQYPFMPESALKIMKPNLVLPLKEIAETLAFITKGNLL